VVVQRCPGVHAVDGSPKAREEGRDSGAPYKSRCSAPGEVDQGVMPGHPRYCADVHCTESDTIILDRFCLERYGLILAMSCSAAGSRTKRPEGVRDGREPSLPGLRHGRQQGTA
jgi:hypothetical protein